MKKHAVLVLVAIYKAGDYIASKIQNLTQQTIFNECCFVLLNCQNLQNERSKYSHILHYNNVIEILYDDYVRLYSSWNDGIRRSDSKYICNSNVDDLWKPDFLEVCSDHLDKNASTSVVSTNIMVTRTSNQGDVNNWKYDHYMPKGLVYPLTTAGPCPVWRRDLHDKYGYFDDYRTIGDAKMWEKWLAGGELFSVIDKDLVLYYASANSLERRVDESNVSYRDLDLKDYEQARKNLS